MEQKLQNKLPVRFRAEVTDTDWDKLEEIRLRAGSPMELYYGNGQTKLIGRVARSDISEMLNYLTGYCMYAYEDEIRQGFFTIEGGHRVGIVGKADTRHHSGEVFVEGIRHIGGINLRIAHEKKDVSAPIIPFIRNGNDIHNTFILARPGVGKTTCLRDCIRILSGGTDGRDKLKICVVDERSEIAACHGGVPQNDLGERTDVLDNCPKMKGMQMLLRSMSPQIIAMDELGGEEDFRMLFTVLYSGSKVLGTVHTDTVEQVMEKPYMRLLMEQEMIQRLIVLDKGKDGKRNFRVYDNKMQQIG